MTIEAVFDVQIIPHAENHWDLTNARYEQKTLHVEFQDGTKGAIPISNFPELDKATEDDFNDLEVSPCGLVLENERIEWDYAEAGLYDLVHSQKHDESGHMPKSVTTHDVE